MLKRPGNYFSNPPGRPNNLSFLGHVGWAW